MPRQLIAPRRRLGKHVADEQRKFGPSSLLSTSMHVCFERRLGQIASTCCLLCLISDSCHTLPPGCPHDSACNYCHEVHDHKHVNLDEKQRTAIAELNESQLWTLALPHLQEKA